MSQFNAAKLEVNKLVDSVDKTYIYHYDGSLTTPGCAEIVEWIVVDSPQPISADQLKRFTSKWADDYSYAGGFGNARIAQPLNGRTIYYSAAVTRILQTVSIAMGMIFLLVLA